MCGKTLLIVPFITGKQIINNAQEIIIPKLKGWWQNYSVSEKYCQKYLFEENILSLVKAEQHPGFTDRAGLSAGGKRGSVSRIFGNG